MSLATFMADPAVPDDVKQRQFGRLWAKMTPGQKREYFYERYVGRPLHKAVGGAIQEVMHPIRSLEYPWQHRGQPMPLDPKSWASTAADFLAPSDLEGAGTLIGGTLGGPFGAELGGTLGGIGQGRSVGRSALYAAPGALMWKFGPWLAKKGSNLVGGLYDETVSNKATAAISGAAKKMFRTVLRKYPELEENWPVTPHDMANYFAEGASPITQKAGEGLGELRRIIAGQPAFYQPGTAVQVPVTTIDPITKMPLRSWKYMTIKDAMDYNQYLYSRGFSPTGAPRAAMGALPDRANAAIVRDRVLRALQNVPRIGPKAAKQYEDLSHDYGMAKTMEQIFTKDAVQPNGLLNHESIYSKAANPKNLQHIANLEAESVLGQKFDPASGRYVVANPGIGPQKARDFLEQIAPGRQRIAAGDVSHARAGMFGLHMNLIPHTVNAPTAFQPAYVPLSGLVGGLGATKIVQDVTDSGASQ